MPSVFDHPFKQNPQLRLPRRIAIPFGKHAGGHFNVAPKLLGRMSAQKQAVEKSGLPLGELEFPQRVFRVRSLRCRVGLCRHDKKRKFTDFNVRVKSTSTETAPESQ